LSVCSLLLLFVLARLVYYWLYKTPLEDSVGKDFFSFYSASQMLHAGKAAEIFIPESFKAMLHGYGYDHMWQWLYPPSFLPVIGWLQALPYYPAQVVFVGLQLALYAAACWKYLARDRVEMLVFLGIPCVAMGLVFGQVVVLIGALYILGFRFLEKNPELAGMCWGLAAVKPSLLVFIPVMLLASRNYRALVWMVVTMALMGVFSIWIYGVDIWVNYLTINIPSLKYYLSELRPHHYDMPTVYAMLLMLGVRASYMQVVEVLLLLVGAVWVWCLSRGGREIMLWQAAVVSLLTMLVTPYASYDDFVIAVPFFVAWFIRRFDDMGVGGLAVLLAVYWLDRITLLLNHALVPVMPLLLLGAVGFVYRAERRVMK